MRRNKQSKAGFNFINKFCTFKAEKPEPENNEILIYGPITDLAFFPDEVTTQDVLDRLFDLGDAEEITVRVNSPGGLVYEGISIYNALVRHPAEITVAIDGLAASAASVIAMAGDKIKMQDNAAMMIHEPWTIVLGSQNDLRKEADVLGKVSEGMANTYAARTGQDKETIKTMLAEETWFTADEAVENGFADTVVKSKSKPNAKVDLNVFNNVPDWVKEQYHMEAPPAGAQQDGPDIEQPPAAKYRKRKMQIINLV